MRESRRLFHAVAEPAREVVVQRGLKTTGGRIADAGESGSFCAVPDEGVPGLNLEPVPGLLRRVSGWRVDG